MQEVGQYIDPVKKQWVDLSEVIAINGRKDHTELVFSGGYRVAVSDPFLVIGKKVNDAKSARAAKA